MPPKDDKNTNTAIAAPINQSIGAAKVLGEEDSGAGFEGTGAQDYAVPFLVLLQKGSPEVDESEGAYVEGAKAGMFLNKATGQLFESVRIVPCLYTRKMVEWKDREKGGGFVAQHEPGEERGLPLNAKGVPCRENGNILVDTRYFFCLLLLPEGGTQSVVVAMSSTQLKKSKTWMTRMQNMKAKRADGSTFTPAMYSHVWALSSVDEENDKGKWKGYKIELEGPIQAEDLFTNAKGMRVAFQGATIAPEQVRLIEGERAM